MNGFGVTLVMGGVVAVVVVFVLVRRRRRNKVRVIAPQGAVPAIPVQRTVVTEEAESAPIALPVGLDDDDLDGFTLVWKELCELLRGNGEQPAHKALGSDGAFGHRSDIRFTVAHTGSRCVVVRVSPPNAPSARRYIIDLLVPRVLMRSEPRQPGASNENRTIAIEQAKNAEAVDMVPCDEGVVYDLLHELHGTYYTGRI